MAIPNITPLPPAPTRADGAVDFSEKADAFVAALPPFVQQTNSLAGAINTGILEAGKSQNAAANSATAAANSAIAAANSLTQAKDEAGKAAQQAASAQTYAASAQSAAGVPALKGKARRVLSVKPDESGVEWVSVTRQVGETIWSVTDPGSDYLPMDGARYPVSSYPLLAVAIGDLREYGLDWTQIVSPANPTAGVAVYDVCWARNVGPWSTDTPALIAVGASGRIWRSTDYGLTWTQAIYGNAQFTAVDADDYGVVIAVGASGIMYRSSDCGATFTAITSGFGTATITSISAYPAFDWIAVGSGVTRYSSDYGVTWVTKSNTVSSPTTAAYPKWTKQEPRRMRVTNPTRGRTNLTALTAASGQQISRADLRWENNVLLSNLTVPNTAIAALTMNDYSYTAIAVGAAGFMLRGEMAMTNVDVLTSAGTTMPLQLYGVDCAWENFWVVVGASGLITISEDDGWTWKTVRSNVTTHLQGVAVCPDGTIVAVGLGGVILRSAPYKDTNSNTEFKVPFVKPNGKLKAYIKAKESM